MVDLFLSPADYFWLWCVAVVTGFVDSIAGGGGLISLPVLLSLGLTPQAAIATNKIQAIFGTVSSVYFYRRAKLVRIREVGLGVFFSGLGAALGVWVLKSADSEFLKSVVPWLLLLIFLFTLFSKKLGVSDQKQRVQPVFFYIGMGLILGFYDGFFGPGTGAFWAISFVTLLGFNFLKATAHTKVMNMASNLVSVVMFLTLGLAEWHLGLWMASGQMLGTYLGTRFVIKKGTVWVRLIFLIVVGLSLTRLFWMLFKN